MENNSKKILLHKINVLNEKIKNFEKFNISEHKIYRLKKRIKLYEDQLGNL